MLVTIGRYDLASLNRVMALDLFAAGHYDCAVFFFSGGCQFLKFACYYYISFSFDLDAQNVEFLQGV